MINFGGIIEFKDVSLHIEDSCFSVTVIGDELKAKMEEAKDILPFEDCYTGEDCSTIWCDTSMGTVEFFQAFIIWQNWLMELFPTYQTNFLEQFNNDWSYS
jgi:hypothetical protein